MRARAATVAGVLCLATTVSATGSAIINNNCPFDVYLWPVSVDESPSSATIISSNGGTWNTQYKSASSGGWSLKLAATNDISTGITQFEYTLDPGTIWYDISNVNCLPFGTGVCPFEADGMVLASGSGCPVATCEAGNATCHDAYTYPDDNWASLSCDSSADTTLNLCGSSSSSSGGLIGEAASVVSSVTSAVGNLLSSSSSSEAPSTSTTPTSTAAPTTSTTPTPTPTPTTSSTTSTSTSSSSTSTSSSSTSSSVEAVSTPATSSSSHHAWSYPAGEVAAAAAPTSSETSSSYVATTLATVAATTPAPAQPNVAVVYETVTQMVSTTVVYQHRMFHKERRGNAHPHARRHHHEE